jgi:hypothetical protein
LAEPHASPAGAASRPPAFFLTTRAYQHTVQDYLESWGRQFRDLLIPLPYETIVEQRQIPIGHYIFSDIERLDAEATRFASAAWLQLSRSNPELRRINHPNRSMRRYELLRMLHDRGINDFNVYRLTEGRFSERYPVFLRGVDDHIGPRGGLLHDRAALDDAIDTLVEQGVPRDSILIVEFRDTIGTDGLYRKYAVWKIGAGLFGAHILFSRNWLQKDPDIVNDKTIAEEWAFVSSGGYLDQVEPVFAAAAIDYGRMDFSVRDGRVQVWEINTNPMMVGNSDKIPARRAIAELLHARIASSLRDVTGS